MSYGYWFLIMWPAAFVLGLTVGWFGRLWGRRK